MSFKDEKIDYLKKMDSCDKELLKYIFPLGKKGNFLYHRIMTNPKNERELKYAQLNLFYCEILKDLKDSNSYEIEPMLFEENIGVSLLVDYVNSCFSKENVKKKLAKYNDPVILANIMYSLSVADKTKEKTGILSVTRSNIDVEIDSIIKFLKLASYLFKFTKDLNKMVDENHNSYRKMTDKDFEDFEIYVNTLNQLNIDGKIPEIEQEDSWFSSKIMNKIKEG